MEYNRSYYECVPCGHKEFLADKRIAQDVCTVSLGAEQLISLAGASWGYGRASEYLKLLTGIHVCKNTVRHISQKTGAKINRWHKENPAAHEKFIQAKGVTELMVDGTMVNTWHGWKEVRVTVFSKRLSGEMSDYSMMESRNLPSPSAVFCIGRCESSEKSISHWKGLAKSLRIHNFGNLHVVGDGATWIWKGAERIFPNHDGCLDFYHAGEHLHDGAERLHGKGHTEVKPTYDHWRTSLLKWGWSGLQKEFLAIKEGLSLEAWKEKMEGLYNYFEKLSSYLDYPDRLRKGLVIGSGQVEGACKNMVGHRLKQTGARWKIMRLNRMLGLTSLVYTNDWDAYWRSLNCHLIAKPKKINNNSINNHNAKLPNFARKI